MRRRPRPTRGLSRQEEKSILARAYEMFENKFREIGEEAKSLLAM
jgi:hypothetical protein